MRKKWIVITIVLVVFLVLVLFGMRGCKAKLKAAIPQQTQETYTVKRGTLESKIEITGEIQPQTTVQIKSKVSGKVVKFYADENDFVHTGDIICDVEPDYNQANTLASVKSRLQLAEIRKKNALKDEADKKSLLSKNYVSQKEYDAAKDELVAANIEYEQANQQYDLVKELDTNGKVTHVYATASGTVIQRPVQVGEMITSSNSGFGEGTVIAKVADLSHMVVQSNINEVDIAKFSMGQAAEIKVDALPYDTFSGKVTKIAPMAVVDNNAQVFPVEISLMGSNKALRPGMTANVSIVGKTHANVLLIPIRAVFSNESNQDIVYLVKDSTAAVQAPVGKQPAVKGKAARGKNVAMAMPVKLQSTPTPVKLGSNDMQNVEVLEGLKEGDKILLTDPNTSGKIQMNFQGF